MNLIEEAAKRLSELEKAGIDPPGTTALRRQDRQPSGQPEPIARAPAQRHSAQTPVKKAGDTLWEPVLTEEVAAAAAPNALRIDHGRLQAAGFLTPGVVDSKLLHEFRVVKRPLIQNALGKSAAPIANRNLIMVTSALPAEGKSFVSLNLALSIAREVDCTVLLVDADVLSPAIPRLLNIEPTRGLIDVLRDPKLSIGDVLLKTDIERLSLVLAGRRHRGTAELLASEAMARLLEEISSRYRDRIVIFDSPPLLATTESRILATHMGQVVVVVEADRTTHGTLESALSTIESCPVVMTMLNKTQESEVGSYYGNYGYGRSE